MGRLSRDTPLGDVSAAVALRAGRRLALAASLALVATACFERGGDRKEKPPPAVEKDSAAAVAITIGAAPEPTAEPAADAAIAIALPSDPPHLNPLFGDALANQIVLGDVYEGLLCRDKPTSAPVACLAESYDVDASGRVWRFRLRDGVVFHDGEALGVDDVEFTLSLVRGKVPTLLAADFADVTKVSSEGRHITVTFREFRMDRADAFVRLAILPKHRFAPVVKPGKGAALVAASQSREPVGTGPLAFVAWKRGESISLARNTSYWGRAAGAATVKYRIAPSIEVVRARVAAGELDVVPSISLDDATTLAAEFPAMVPYRFHRPAYLAAVLNLRRPALESADHRKALSHLVDRKALSRALFGGVAHPIAGPFVRGSAAHDPAITPRPFDRARAAALIGEGGLAVKLLVPTESRSMRRLADIWAADAKGVAALSVEFAPYVDVLRRVKAADFDVALLAFTTGENVDLYHRFHSSQVGRENYGRLADEALDELLVDARAEVNPTRRAAVMRKIGARLFELEPYVFLLSDSRVGLVRRGVGGVSVSDGLSARRIWRAR